MARRQFTPLKQRARNAITMRGGSGRKRIQPNLGEGSGPPVPTYVVTNDGSWNLTDTGGGRGDMN